MTEHEASTGGWLERLRRFGQSSLGLARGRIELFAVELQEEKLRLLDLLVWLGLALAMGLSALLVIVGALSIWLWHLAGYLGLATLALVTLAAAALVLWTVRRRIRLGPTPFAETISEFRKDAACFKRGS
jgi:uncharacterized membrane protein YqjE